MTGSNWQRSIKLEKSLVLNLKSVNHRVLAEEERGSKKNNLSTSGGKGPAPLKLKED